MVVEEVAAVPVAWLWLVVVVVVLVVLVSVLVVVVVLLAVVVAVDHFHQMRELWSASVVTEQRPSSW